MPTFYNFTENGVAYSFDDVFIPADVFRNGNLFTWGSGTQLQLGNNTATNASTPVTTFAGGTNWKQVSCGYHTAAVKTDGTLWGWGANTSGQLGINNLSNRSTPVTTFAGGTTWKQVSCGQLHTLALSDDTINKRLFVFGNNTNGQLGNRLSIFNPVTTFAGGTNWKQVSCGYHIAAVKTDGTLWTWGNNANGQIGINDTITIKTTPVTTFAGGTTWKQVSCGSFHTAAIKTDGTLWTWGSGTSGKLGDNTTTSKSTPVTTFAGGSNWKQVSSGGSHTAAVIYDDPVI